MGRRVVKFRRDDRSGDPAKVKMKISTTEQRLIKTGAGRKRPGIALLNAIVGALACAVVAVAWADDITGKNDVLCASANANVCSDDGSCAPASP